MVGSNVYQQYSKAFFITLQIKKYYRKEAGNSNGLKLRCTSTINFFLNVHVYPLFLPLPPQKEGKYKNRSFCSPNESGLLLVLRRED